MDFQKALTVSNNPSILNDVTSLYDFIYFLTQEHAVAPIDAVNGIAPCGVDMDFFTEANDWLADIQPELNECFDAWNIVVMFFQNPNV